jgi:type IV pilus assembly protein PilY1
MVDITTGKVLAKKYFTETDYSSGGAQIGFSDMKYAFASSPAVFDLDFDGFADVVYIGDLGGNLWKWVIRAVGDDPINNTGSEDNLAQPDWPFGLFSRASTSDASYDAGTATWSSGIHFNSFFFPPTGVLRGSTLLLALGSAERANPTAWDNDGLPGNNNRFYVMKDGDPLERATETPASGDLVVGGTGPALRESHLQDITSITPNCSDLHTNYKGYYIVANDAEKFITRSLVFLGKVLTGSYTPSDPSTGDVCEKAGSASLYIFGVDCGSGQFTPATGHTANDTPDKQRRTDAGSGVPTRPRISVGDINQDGGGGANRAIVVTSDGGITMEDAGNASSSGVDIRTWRER